MKQASEGILSTFSLFPLEVMMVYGESLIPAGFSMPAHLSSHSTTACIRPSTTVQGAAPCTLLLLITAICGCTGTAQSTISLNVSRFGFVIMQENWIKKKKLHLKIKEEGK